MEWNIGYVIKKWAVITPDKAALIYEDKPITYKALDDGANKFANFLKEKGLKNGDRIAVDILNCPEFFEIYFAAARLGLIFVPLNFRLVGPELEYALNNCGARALVFHDSTLQDILPIHSKVKVEDGKFVYLRSEGSDELDCPAWAVDYHEIMGNYSLEEPEPYRPVEFDDPLCIMYTSGVTGDPKGAVLSHQQTYFKNFQNILYTDMRQDDIYLAQVPLFHSGGLFVASMPTLCRGATLVLRRGFDAEKFALDIERYKATILLGMTSMLKMVIENGTLNRVDTSSVRVMIGGGERTPFSLVEDLAEVGLHMQMGYGQTENSAMMMKPKDYIYTKRGSIGLSGFFTEIWIADKEGKKLLQGEIGEIVAKGPVVMSSYWNMPEKTAEAIVDGVLHTGDLGYIDEDGFFYIVDREKDMYRSGGENVYPAEIEKILADHPKILLVAIIGVPDDKWGETGKAFVVPKEGETLDMEDMTDFLQGKAARYKYPKQLKVLDELPMTASGKVKKAELKKIYGVRLNE